jgi:protein-tyrosine phosphatase
MKRILPYPLWLGHAGDGRNFRAIFAAGIKAVVYLAAEEPLPALPRDLIACRIPLLDGSGNNAGHLSLAVHTAAELLKSSVPTLVCCGAGLSRSPVIAAAALASAYDKPPDACLAEVLQHHPADVSPALWQIVLTVLQRPNQPVE